jgi:hypothetical protein
MARATVDRSIVLALIGCGLATAAPSGSAAAAAAATDSADSSAASIVGQGAQSGPSATNAYSLPVDRVTLWQPGVSYAPTSGSHAPARPPAGWSGGIPARANICATLHPRGHGRDDTVAINAALDSCPANQTVLLTPGEFVITGYGIQMTKSYVTLRGSGPGPGMKGALTTFPSATEATLLVKPDGNDNPYPVVTIGTITNLSINSLWETRALATDAIQGMNSVTLTAAAPRGLEPGEIVYINETYDPALTWYNSKGGQGSGSYDGWGEGQSGVSATSSRPLGQAMEVASISGNIVTFTTPFHQTYRIAHAAHIGRIELSERTSWVGLENLFLTGGDGGDGGGNVVFGAASYSWAKNIESAGHGPKFGGGLAHFFASFRCELRDSYLHSNAADISRISPGGGFYNIMLDSYSSDTLVENNISWIANKVMVMRGTGGGNVIGYNYMDDGYGNYYPNQGETALNADHMTTSHHELLEGNYSWSLGTDSRWGNSIFITWFRNWASAQRISAWPDIPATSVASGNPLTSFVYTTGGMNFYYEDEYNRNPARVGSHHWWFNYVGNVLGNAKLSLLAKPKSFYNVPQTGYAYEVAGLNVGSFSDPIIPIWTVGTPDGSEGASFGGNGFDPSVLPVTLRDGNFDYYTHQVHWHGIGGSGTGQTTPPGASQSRGTVLPNSLYLPGKPAFFGSSPWPWVDGSNASNPIPGELPAQSRFNLGTPNTIQ